MNVHGFCARACAIAVLVAMAGCRQDPVSKALRFAESGDKYMVAHRWKEAIVEYGNAIKAQPDDADIHYKKAWACQEAGDLPSAYRAFARAADLNPSNVDAHLRAGGLLLAAGEFDAARLRAEEALRADGQNVAAHLLLGNALGALNAPSQAIQQIEEALRIAPTS